MDLITRFLGILQSEGFVPVKPLEEYRGGNWPRLRYMNEKKSSGRYALHIKGDIACATYGSDKADGFKTWRSWEGQTLKSEDIKAAKKWFDEKQKLQDKAEKARHIKIARRLTKVYKNLPAAPADHPYLVKKEITPHPLIKYRPKTKGLVLPMLQPDGKAGSLQFIAESGAKWFFTGGKVKDGFLPITSAGDDFGDVIYITEGYATGQSIRDATNRPVICSFTAGNLPAIAKAMKNKHSSALIVIAADNDQFPSKDWPEKKPWKNTGIDRGTQAAGLSGGLLKYPDFDEDTHDLRPTDWNDYACIYGKEKLKSALAVEKSYALPKEQILSPKSDDSAAASSPHGNLTPAENKWRLTMSQVRWKGGQTGFFDDKHSIHNAILYLSYHPDWGGTFVYDEFGHQNVVVKPLPWDDKATFKWRETTDADLTQLRAMLWSKNNIKLGSKAEINDVLEVVSKNKTVHPVRTYFDGLLWDGTARLDDWILKYCNPQGGNPDYLRKVAACFLLAAVKRIYFPATFHKQVLVLEGAQDIGKSTLLRELATFNGVEYFSDKISFKHIGNPYLCAYLAGILILEFAELRGFQAQDQNIIKAFITQTDDEMQPKHKMRVVRYPRQFVMAATVNNSQYLVDATGGVRFWPVHCGKIDIHGINLVKQQLWAEAVHRIKRGEEHWIKDDDPVYNTMKLEQAQRFEGNVWLEPIRTYLDGAEQADVDDILKNGLFVPVERWSNKYKEQVRECLRELGYDNKPKRVNGKVVRVWINQNYYAKTDEKDIDIPF